MGRLQHLVRIPITVNFLADGKNFPTRRTNHCSPLCHLKQRQYQPLFSHMIILIQPPTYATACCHPLVSFLNCLAFVQLVDLQLVVAFIQTLVFLLHLLLLLVQFLLQFFSLVECHICGPKVASTDAQMTKLTSLPSSVFVVCPQHKLLKVL